jgi:hypothetical protein
VYHIDAEELSKEIRSRKESLYKNLRKIKDLNKESNDYQSTKQKIQDDLDFVLKYKLRMSSDDIELLDKFLSSGRSHIYDIIYDENLRISLIGLVASVGFIAFFSPTLALSFIVFLVVFTIYVVKKSSVK